MHDPRWRKSSKTNTSNCVELAHTLAHVRDSKNPTGPTLAVDLAAFLITVKTGKLDR